MNNPFYDVRQLLCNDQLLADLQVYIKLIAKYILEAKQANKIVTIFGNGGSAADSQHWAAELVCTYRSRQRSPYPAVALTTNSSVLTAWPNDFEYESVFMRQVRAFSPVNGLSIGLSTSGRSMNVLAALQEAKENCTRTVLISGNGREELADVNLHVRFPTTDTPAVQTLTQMLYHGVCEILE